MNPDIIRRTLRGFRRIDFDEFCAVLHRHGMTEDYALFEAWPKFQVDPFSFIAGYNPRRMCEEILELAKVKGDPKPREVRSVG